MNSTEGPDRAVRGSGKGRRRDAGDGSIFQRADGRWVGRLTDAGRSRYYYGRTKADVKARLKAAIKARDQGELPVRTPTTFGSYLEEWLASLSGSGLKASTVDYYTRYVRHHLLPCPLAARPLQRLTPGDLEALYRSKDEEGLSATTIHHLHAVIHRCLVRAVRQGALSRNVADLVDAPGTRRPRLAVLSGDEPEALMKAVEGHPLEGVFVLAVTTGMRRGELLALRWGDVDLESGTLAVVGSLQGTRAASLTIGTTKTGHNRKVALAPVAIEALRRQRERQSRDRSRAGSLWREMGLVFTNPTGGFLSPSSVTHSLDRVLREASLPDIRFHDLRHSAATRMLSRGVHPKVASEMLGHSSVAITLDLYSHVTETLQREAVTRAWAQGPGPVASGEAGQGSAS